MVNQLEFDFESPHLTDRGYERWLRERAARASQKSRKRGKLRQGELPATGDESGYERWRSEQAELRSRCEKQWGVILGTPVRVNLTFIDAPVRGIVSIASPDAYEPTFRIRDLSFTTSDILSIQREY